MSRPRTYHSTVRAEAATRTAGRASLGESAIAEALQAIVDLRPRYAHRNRTATRLRARLSSNEFRTRTMKST